MRGCLLFVVPLFLVLVHLSFCKRVQEPGPIPHHLDNQRTVYDVYIDSQSRTDAREIAKEWRQKLTDLGYLVSVKVSSAMMLEVAVENPTLHDTRQVVTDHFKSLPSYRLSQKRSDKIHVQS